MPTRYVTLNETNRQNPNWKQLYQTHDLDEDWIRLVKVMGFFSLFFLDVITDILPSILRRLILYLE